MAYGYVSAAQKGLRVNDNEIKLAFETECDRLPYSMHNIYRPAYEDFKKNV